METKQSGPLPLSQPLPPMQKKWYQHKGLQTIAILAVIAAGISWLTLGNSPKNEPVAIDSNVKNPAKPALENRFKVWDDGTAYVKGEVVGHESGCESDGTCKLIVQTPNEQVVLVYAEGDGKCPNLQAVTWVQRGKNVTKGTAIKAYGAYKKLGNEHQLTFCASQDYFILGENDPVPAGLYTEKFFDEVIQNRNNTALVAPERVNLYLLMENGKPVLELSAVVGGGCSQGPDLATEERAEGNTILVGILGHLPYQNGQDADFPSCAMVAESKKQIILDTKLLTANGKQVILSLNGKQNSYSLRLENNILILSPVSASNVITAKFGKNPPKEAIEVRLNVTTSSSLPATLVLFESYGGLCQYGGCSHKVTFFNNGDLRDETPTYDKGSSSYVTKVTEKQISTLELNDLLTKINNTDFEKVKQRKFEDLCPTAYDGTAITYTIYKNQNTERLDTCEYILDEPLFKTVYQLVEKYSFSAQ